MESITSIKKMLKEGRIIVPDYQRAYSWEVRKDGGEPLQVDVFLSDIEQYAATSSVAYYLGHFLFEKTGEKTGDGDDILAVVDGQQRLTTITIFLSALFDRISELRSLTDSEVHLKEDLVRRGREVRFETVEHDRIFFREYVIDRTNMVRENLPYVSQRRIADAADYLRDYFAGKTEAQLLKLLEAVANAKCTTDTVGNSGEAMQLFLFQNNRGKKPSKLEVVKALLMRTAYLQGGTSRGTVLRDMDARFTEIYRNLADIEDYADEDDILACACRIEGNSLYAEVALSSIEKSLLEKGVEWAECFAICISDCFKNLRLFFCEDSEKFLEANALRHIGCGSWALPFVVKAYAIGLLPDDRTKIWRILESLMVRQRMIGTRANLISRLNDVFQAMTGDSAVRMLDERLKAIGKADDWWWSYWTDARLEECLRSEITDRAVSRFLLWRYENTLIAGAEEGGYSWQRFSDIVSPELEHIAPQTPTNDEPLANGYGAYEDADNPESGIVSGRWLDSIGNHLILPKSHNCQIGNKPFSDKFATYTHSEQQLEVRKIAEERKAITGELVWDKTCIEHRRDCIVNAIMGVYSPFSNQL